MMKSALTCSAALALLLVLPVSALAEVEVLGLFKNAALLKKDGQQKLLRVGQEWQGIELLEASSEQATARVNGETMTLLVSTKVSTNFAEPKNRQVVIRKNNSRQYITTARINGRTVKVLVDTGANIVAINSGTAATLGVDTTNAPVSRVSTASGIVNAYSVLLRRVDVGGIEIEHVQASILDGDFPDIVLLGTSYLQHVHMQERDGVLMLTSKY
ncbi:MAG: retropepsin-like aspartic protease [Pseudomonadota bacterium]